MAYLERGFSRLAKRNIAITKMRYKRMFNQEYSIPVQGQFNSGVEFPSMFENPIDETNSHATRQSNWVDRVCEAI